MGLLGFRWLVNFGLLAIPIASTLGILIGLQSHRDATGQAPLFTGDDGDDGTGDGGNVDKNGIEYIRNCDKAYGITPDSKGQEYTRKSPPTGTSPSFTRYGRKAMVNPRGHTIAQASLVRRLLLLHDFYSKFGLCSVPFIQSMNVNLFANHSKPQSMGC